MDNSSQYCFQWRVTLSVQMLGDQIFQDDAVRHLSSELEKIFLFLEEGDDLKNLDGDSQAFKNQRTTLCQMVQQSIECAYFLIAYAKPAFCEPLFWIDFRIFSHVEFLGGRFSASFSNDATAKVTEYSTTLLNLKQDFLSRAATVTEITSLRTFSKLNHMESKLNDIDEGVVNMGEILLYCCFKEVLTCVQLLENYV